MKFFIIGLSCFASLFARADVLSCIYQGDVKVFYDKGTKDIFKKNAAVLPTKAILSKDVHCMSEFRGAISKSTTPWSNGGESTRYTLATIGNDGSEWAGYAQFTDTGKGTARFTCNSPLFGNLNLELSNCVMVGNLEP